MTCLSLQLHGGMCWEGRKVQQPPPTHLCSFPKRKPCLGGRSGQTVYLCLASCHTWSSTSGWCFYGGHDWSWGTLSPSAQPFLLIQPWESAAILFCFATVSYSFFWPAVCKRASTCFLGGSHQKRTSTSVLVAHTLFIILVEMIDALHEK